MAFEIGYFLIAFYLFLIYFIIFSLFGYFIFIIIDKENTQKKISSTSILKSFSIGLSLHIVYSVILIALKSFNFFTIYLPFIIFDMIFLIYFYIKNETIREKIGFINKGSILNFIKRNRGYILLLSLIFIMLFLLQNYFISRFLSYQSSDPYYWFKNILFLNNNGYVDYTSLKAYPPGFVAFCTTIISFSNNYYIIYYFLKYIPIFLSGINIFILFLIIKPIFKKKIYIFFTLLIYLSFSFLNFRYTHPIASILATTIGFFFLLFLGNGSSLSIDSNHIKFSKLRRLKLLIKDSLFKGLVLAAIFMAQPLYGIFYLLFFFSFELYILVKLIFSSELKLNRNLSKKYLINNFLTTQLSVILIFILMLLPYLIFISLYLGFPIYEVIFRYYFPLASYTKSIFNYKILESWKAILLFNKPSFLNSTASINSVTRLFVNEAVEAIQYTLIILGIVFSYTKLFKFNKERNDVIKFLKFTFILTVIILLMLYIVKFIPIPIFQSIFNFSVESAYIFRLFELFSGYWAVFFVIAIIYIGHRIAKGLKKYNEKKIPSRDLIKIFKISEIISIILISGFFYFTNFERTTYINYFNDDQTDVVLFVGDFFYKNPLDENTTILLENLEYRFFYNLLEINNLNKKYFEFEFTFELNYSDFKSFFESYYNSYNCKFALFSLVNLSNNFKINLSSDFEIIYENQGSYIFAEIIK